MEERVVEIGEYTVRMRLDGSTLEVVVLDALGDEIEGILISDQEDESEEGDDFDFELDDDDDDDDFKDSNECEGDDDDSHYDDDDYD